MTHLAAASIPPADLTVLLLSLAVMLGLARLLGEVARKYGQPVVLGEILAGVLLGPTFLGALSPQTMHWLFPMTGPANTALQGLTTLAVVLLLLVAGLEVDLSVIWRQGKSAVLVSATGIVFPFTIGFGLALFLPGWFGMDPHAHRLPFALFVGVAMSITALPVIAKILIDLNMLKSDLGMLIMSAAMVDDLVGWIGFALVLSLIGSGGGMAGGVGQTILYTALFVALMLTLGRWTCHRAFPYIQAHTIWPGGMLAFIIVVALLGAAFTEAIGIHAIFGAFIAGVALGDSPHLRERTRDHIHQFVMNLFAPIFFASIGLHLNFIHSFNIVTVLFVLVIAIAVKVGGCYLGAKWAGLAPNESVAIGFGMSARGAMEIVLAQLARQFELITDELFVAIVIMALVTSLLSGPVMQKALGLKLVRQFGDFLTDKHFIPWLKARSAQEAIREMTERAAQLTQLPEKRVFDAVWKREQIMATGLGDGLAVPHARLAELKKPAIILARSERGIDFDAADGKPARIICLLLTPESSQTEQVELLAMFARAFGDEPSRASALAAKTFSEMLAAIKLPGGEAAPPPPGSSEMR